MIQHNGQTLAYIGDAYYELKIREALLETGITKANKLHQAVTVYTSAKGQVEALKQIEHLLTEEELRIIKRGRNAEGSRKPKNIELQHYKLATGFEALIGYLYLCGKLERIHYFLKEILKLRA